MTIDLRAQSDAVPSVNLLDATPRHSPARARSDRRYLLMVLVCLTALGCALLSSASPAGIGLADAVYRGAFGGVVVWAASRSRRWTWAVLAGLAAISAATLLAQISALLALTIAAASLRRSRRAHLAGAIVATLAMPALLTQGVGPIWRLTGGHLNDPFATSAVITLLATVPVLRSGWRTLSRRRRRTIKTRTRYIAWTVAGVLLLSAVVSAAAAPSMLRGLAQTQDAAELARSGRLDLATTQFNNATQAWNRSNSIVSGPWMVPARLVPVLGQHVRAAQVASGQASALTGAAAVTTERVDPDAVIVDGVVDLAEVDRITPAVDALAATLERATERIEETNSPWLIPPVGARIDRAFEVLNPASGVAGVTAEALRFGGDLLGRNEPAQFLIMFSTPAEARGAGGFIGNWALISATDGRITIEEQFRTKELNALLAETEATLIADADYLDRYGRFAIERHIQDVAISPDFPSVAPVAADLFAQATGNTVDAVLSIDPFVIQKLLQFSGPLERSDDRLLTGGNAARELLVDQYIDFGDDEASRETELSELTTSVLSSILETPPDPIAFATEMAPLAEQQRISLWIASDTDGSIAERLGLDGAFPVVDHDLLSIVHQNAGQNKIDSFLQRDVSISTTLDPSNSRVTHDVTITLDNSAPSTGLPDAILASNDQGLDPGTNRMLLSIYTELPVTTATIDGIPAPVQAETEFGRPVYSLVFAIPAGGFRVVDLQLAGTLALEDTYSMTFAAQPTVSPDRYSWHVFAVDGTRIDPPLGWSAHPDGVRWAAGLDRDKTLTFGLDR